MSTNSDRAGARTRAGLLAGGLRPAKGVPALRADQLPRWLQQLETLTIDGLTQEWARRFAEPMPDIRSRDVLRHLIAWRVQAQLFGGYSSETLRSLRGLIAAHGLGAPLKAKAPRRLAPGSVLSREWKGRTHRVTVEASGFSYDGKAYASLSEIARLITGTRWSGPRLFGLEAS